MSLQSETERKTGHLTRISQSLEEKTKTQGNLLSRIEDELHMILNNRNPENKAGSEKDPPPPTTDIVNKLDEIQETMHRNNARLQDILYHIQSLV